LLEICISTKFYHTRTFTTLPFVTMNQDMNTEEFLNETPEPDMMPPTRKRNWLIVYACIGMIGITGLILIALYRQKPQKSAPVAKRKFPATRTVFTSVLAPVDSVTARRIVQDVSATIGKDSDATQMTISGTAVYKRCTSFKDFQTLFYDALVKAEPENLKRQSMLLSHVSGVITSDALPTDLYVVGRIAEDDFEPQEKRLLSFAQVMGRRNESLAPVHITTYFPQGGTARARVMETLRRGKYTLTEHPLAW
jgi:hypothetical protein